MRELSDERSRRGLDAEPEAVLAIVRSWPAPVVSLTVDGVITSWNPAAVALLGYQPSEIIGQYIGALWPPHHKAAEEGLLERLVGGERPDRYRTEWLHQDGSPVPVSLCPAPILDGAGAVVGICAISLPPEVELADARSEREGTERSEREGTEARLRQAERMDSLGQLAGGVAHDFNNLLSVIVNYAAFVAEELEPAAATDPDRWRPVARDVQQIQRATDKGIALSHQLLAFGRREATRPRIVSLNTLVREVQELLRRSVGEGVELVTSLAPGLWPVDVDPGHVERVLVNLAVNARDAMAGGGTLTIDTANEVLDERTVEGRPGLGPGRYVRIRVSDTGAGMPPEVVGRAFEPFFSTKPKGEGTGLGLATVYGLVTQAGGELSIRSEPGAGTTVALLLPASDEVVAEP